MILIMLLLMIRIWMMILVVGINMLYILITIYRHRCWILLFYLIMLLLLFVLWMMLLLCVIDCYCCWYFIYYFRCNYWIIRINLFTNFNMFFIRFGFNWWAIWWFGTRWCRWAWICWSYMILNSWKIVCFFKWTSWKGEKNICLTWLRWFFISGLRWSFMFFIFFIFCL